MEQQHEIHKIKPRYAYALLYLLLKAIKLYMNLACTQSILCWVPRKQDVFGH